MGIDPKGGIMQVARVELAENDRGREYAFIGEVTMPDGRKVKGPLHIQPGLSNWTIILPLGYMGGRRAGRSAAARVSIFIRREMATRRMSSPGPSWKL